MGRYEVRGGGGPAASAAAAELLHLRLPGLRFGATRDATTSSPPASPTPRAGGAFYRGLPHHRHASSHTPHTTTPHTPRSNVPAWARSRTPSPRVHTAAPSSPRPFSAYPMQVMTAPCPSAGGGGLLRAASPRLLHSDMDDRDSTGAPTDPGPPPPGSPAGLGGQAFPPPGSPFREESPPLTPRSPALLRSVSPPARRGTASSRAASRSARRAASPATSVDRVAVGRPTPSSLRRTGSPARVPVLRVPRGGGGGGVGRAASPSQQPGSPRGQARAPPGSPRGGGGVRRGQQQQQLSPRAVRMGRAGGVGVGVVPRRSVTPPGGVVRQHQQHQHRRDLEVESDGLRSDLIAAHARISEQAAEIAQLQAELRERDEAPPPSPPPPQQILPLAQQHLPRDRVLLAKGAEVEQLRGRCAALQGQVAALQAELQSARGGGSPATAPPSPVRLSPLPARTTPPPPPAPAPHPAAGWGDMPGVVQPVLHSRDVEASSRLLGERERRLGEREASLEARAAQLELGWRDVEQMKEVVCSSPAYAGHVLAQRQAEFNLEMEKREDVLHQRALDLTAWEKRLEAEGGGGGGGGFGRPAAVRSFPAAAAGGVVAAGQGQVASVSAPTSASASAAMYGRPSRQISPPPSRKKASNWTLSGEGGV